MKKLAIIALLLCAATAGAQERRYAYFGGGGPRLGVQVTPLTEELRTYFGAQKDAGVLVGKVEAGSTAAQAGLKVGDVLVSVGGIQVDDAGDVRRALGERKEGDTVPVTVVRERRPVTLAARVGKSEPAPEGFTPPEGFELPEGLRMFKLDELEKRLQSIEDRLQKIEGGHAPTRQ
jgi:membrane-associated protease RseP (regulator of RpoE activity)